MAYAPMDVVWLSDQGGNCVCVCVCDVCAKKERSKMEKVRKNKRTKGKKVHVR